jgi:internalin A
VTEEELEEIIEKARIDRSLKLCLGDHQLTSLPKSIGSLSNLSTLYLWENQLTSLPESIRNLTNLTILDTPFPLEEHIKR